jgi:hypothetical protein
MSLHYVKGTRLWLKGHPEFSEAWLRDLIADDPPILGLGPLELRASERAQPNAGRLDLLLQNSKSAKRYTVELTLGRVDESHVVRCMEYWDTERKRFPGYDHCAVLVAEEVTARFLNILQLINGVVPIVVLQVSALLVGHQVALSFTKLLDEVSLGTELEDDPGARSRSWWEARSSAASLKLLDECLALLREVAPELEPRYQKNYIGVSLNNRPNNFVAFRPLRHGLRVEIRAANLRWFEDRFESHGLARLGIDRRWRGLRFVLHPGEVAENEKLLKSLLRAAYKHSPEQAAKGPAQIAMWPEVSGQ